MKCATEHCVFRSGHDGLCRGAYGRPLLALRSYTDAEQGTPLTSEQLTEAMRLLDAIPDDPPAYYPVSAFEVRRPE